MKCELCPRRCGADRENGKIGFCGARKEIKAARAALHFWEEPCISGTRGSGAIFFSGCPLKCVFCQNDEISHENFGENITDKKLADIFKSLENQGAHNINLVSPTPYCDNIINALNIYKPNIPIVYNCGGYERIETLEKIDPYIDIYLPDIKYFSADISEKYSGAKDYFENASRAIKFMTEKKGTAKFDENGIMTSGVILRHLVLPSNIRQTYLIIDWLKNNVSRDTYISLMCQYFPYGSLDKFPEINRKLTKGEYERACNYLLDAGFENGFFQERNSANGKFTPHFDLTGINN